MRIAAWTRLFFPFGLWACGGQAKEQTAAGPYDAGATDVGSYTSNMDAHFNGATSDTELASDALSPQCRGALTFGDPIVEEQVRALLAVDTGPIDADLAAQLTSLVVDNVTSLSGLECLVNLSDLESGGGMIADLSPLARLTRLATLDVAFNHVTDLSPLAGLTQLSTLDVSNNNVTDLTPLAGLTQLTSIWLSSDPVVDLGPLAGLTRLTFLDLHSDQVADLAPLAGLAQLTHLEIENNQVTDLAPLAKLTQLTWLDVSSNQVSNLAPLSSDYSLDFIFASNNHVDSLSGLMLQTAPRCNGLDLSNNPIGTNEFTIPCAQGWLCSWGGADGIDAGGCGDPSECPPSVVGGGH